MALLFEMTSAEPCARVRAWDELMQSSPRGHYTLLSTWLRAYEVFGLRARILHAVDADTGLTVGGAGFVTAGPAPFRFACVPFGPVVDVGHEVHLGALLTALVGSFDSWGAAFMQVQPPHGADTAMNCSALVEGPPSAFSRFVEPGAPLGFALAPSLLQLVDLDGPDGSDAWRHAMLRRFSENTSRNVKASLGRGLELVDAREPAAIRRAFAIIEDNGRQQGYSTRTWKQFGQSLIEQIRAGHARVLLATHGGRDVGAHYALLAGRRYCYMMGGTVRLEQDLKVGHFLHFAAIELARHLRMDAYDLTSGGSEGVARFKMGFRPRRIVLTPPVHIVLSPARMAAFRLASRVTQAQKSRIANTINRLVALTKRSPASKSEDGRG